MNQNISGTGVQTWNFAVDESTVSCVLHGKRPARHYKNSRIRFGMEPYPVDADGVQRPLKLLRSAKPSHVVLSIGGNDARVRFLQSRDPRKIANLMVSDGIISNLHRLIEIIQTEVTPNIILVYVYMPQYKACPILSLLPPASILHALLVNFSKFYIEAANKYGLPLVDLSRTFDPNDRSHYGSTPIEPSNKSGQFIVDLVIKVLKEFKFGQESGAKVYSGTGENIVVQDASPGLSFDYETELNMFLDQMASKKGHGCSIA
ncbi:unnamed protein product [Choristocarpus tenellus]